MEARFRDRTWDIAALLACLLLAAALLLTFVLTPAPKPETAPLTGFSAARAFKDVAVIARAPHPVGSAANRQVRDHLLARMAALGLGPQLRTREGLTVARHPERPRAYGATVDNIVGVLPGRDRKAQALTLIAHYDSVAASPGAGDDASGVAAALEVVRALKARGAPARDVMLVFTDGEEAGLLGAEAFFSGDPLAGRVGTIINLETRGGGGRAAMFETGKANGGLVRALASGAVHAPLANSAAVFAYRQMPNSTDFTPAQTAGKTGYNFAFLGRQFDYHSPTSTLANLDKGSLQSLGNEVLPLAARLAFGAEVKPAPDLVFSQVAGAWIIAYPPVFGWAVLAAAALLIGIAYAKARPGWRDLMVGALCGLAVLLLAAALLHLARLATGIGFSFVGQRPLLARFGLWEAAMLLLALSPAALLARFARNRLPGAWLGLLLVLLLAAIGLQAAAPLAAYLLAWPLLLAAVLAAVWVGINGRVGPLLVVLGAGFGLAWLLTYAHFLSQAVDLPAALAVFVLPAAALLWPLSRPVGFRTAAVLFMSGLAIVALIRLTSAWSARHPQATGAYYVAQPGTGFFRAAPASLDGPWLRKTLGEGSVVRPLPPLNNRVRIATAPPVAYQPLPYSFERRPDGTVRLSIPWRPDLQELAVDLRATGPVREVTLNGRPAGAMLPASGKWSSLIFWPSEPLDLVFRPAGKGRLEFRYAAVTQAWPKDAAPLPPRGPKEMPWMDTDALAVVGEAALDFP